MASVYTKSPSNVVLYYTPDDVRVSDEFLSTQFGEGTFTQLVLASNAVPLAGGEYPVGRTASGASGSTTLSDTSLSTTAQRNLTAGLRRRLVRTYLRRYYDSGYLSLATGVLESLVNNILTHIATAASNDANLYTNNRWNDISKWLEVEPGDLIKNISFTAWNPFTPQSGTFYTFIPQGGGRTATTSGIVLSGNNETLRNFVL